MPTGCAEDDIPRGVYGPPTHQYRIVETGGPVVVALTNGDLVGRNQVSLLPSFEC